MRVSIPALIATARSGRRLISFPTDTVPALAARPDQASLIFAAKQRPLDKPLILMGASAEALWPYVQGSPEEWDIWQRVAHQHWPGALTLVLPASDRLPQVMNPLNATTIGLRVPNWPFATMILQQTGPLATTSVNLTGQPPLEALVDIEQQFPEVLLPDTEWPLPGKSSMAVATAGMPSTVAQWTEPGWTILRQGAVKLDKR